MAELRHHSCPAISLAHLTWDDNPSAAGHPGVARPAAAQLAPGHPGAQTAARHLLFSGGTDGSIAIWDVTAAVQGAQSTGGSNGAAASASCYAGGNNSAATAGRAEGAAAVAQLAPLAVLQGVHQSGINGLAAAWLSRPPAAPAAGAPANAAAAANGLQSGHSTRSGGGSATGSSGGSDAGMTGSGSGRGDGGSNCSGGDRTAALVSGGDDQALVVTAVAFASGSSLVLASGDAAAAADATAAAAAAASAGPGQKAAAHAAAATVAGVGAVQRLPNAHASAVRAVWTDGDRVASTGLDQRVRFWRITAQPFDSSGGSDGSGGMAADVQQQEAGSSTSAKQVAVAPAVGADRSGAAAEADLPCLSLIEEAEEVVQVLEPSCMSVAPVGNNFAVAVAGRGLQVLTAKP